MRDRTPSRTSVPGSKLSHHSKKSSRHETSALKEMQENNCELCGGLGYGGPCETVIEQLREELMELIQ